MIVPTMSSAIKSVLGLDKNQLEGTVVIIKENSGSDANFILSTIISERIEKNAFICLVPMHNTFGHYHNVGMKLGYNLNALKEKGMVQIIEPLKIIPNNLRNEKQEVDFLAPNRTKVVELLFGAITERVCNLQRETSSGVIVLDDLSHLIDLAVSERDVMIFCNQLRNLVHKYPKLTLVINVHIATEADQILANSLAHVCDLLVTVSPLETGRYAEVTGKMEVRWQHEKEWDKDTTTWNQQTVYHFKLLDRQIKVFAPGTVIRT